MRYAEAYAHLLRSTDKAAAVRNDDESGGVLLLRESPFLQDLKAEVFCRGTAGDGCLVLQSLAGHLLGCHRGVQHILLLPVRVLALQILPALRESLRVGINNIDVIDRCPGKSHQHMIDLQHLLSDNIVVVFQEKIIDVRYTSCRRVLDRQHREIRLSVCHKLHRLFPGFYMGALDRIIKKFLHRLEAVRSVDTLKDNPGIVKIQMIHQRVIRRKGNPVLSQKLILTFPADCHQLLEKFPHTPPVEFRMSQTGQILQFFLFSLTVKDFLSALDLVVRDSFHKLHTLLKEADNLLVRLVDFLAIMIQF